MVKVLDSGLKVCEYKLQSHYYIHFWTNILEKGMNTLILPTMDQIVSLLFSNKDGCGIK